LDAPEPRRLGQAAALPAPESSLTPFHLDPPVKAALRKPATCDPISNGKMPAAPASMPVMPGMNPAASPDRSSAAPERVLAAFQETMQKFLEVQRTTMLAYFSGRQQQPADLPARHAGALPPPERSAPVAVSAATDTPRPPSHGVAGAVSPAGTNKPPAPVPAGREEIARMLLDIVRERTGYPPEVLRLELDLEAELGIDSIKRVEILGKLRDAFPQLGNASDPEAMDRLVSARTLAAIVDRVERAIGSAGAAAAPNPNPPAPTPLEPAAAGGTRNGKVHGGARRLLLEAVEAPLGGAEGGLMTGGTVLITEDDRGIAEALAGAIRSRGWQAAIIGGPDSRLDWTSPAAVDKAIRQARRDGPFVGLAHLLPLQSARILEIDAAAWADRMSPEVRGLFLLAKGMGGDLERAAERGGACLIATTAMGGRFASTGRSEVDFFPGHGAIAGLIKTIAREWISVRTRVIDLNVNDGTPRLAERILAEIFHDDAWSEVGYAGARRIRLRTVPAPLSSKAGQDDFSLAPGEPVLITGGARGITSLVAAELARRWRPTLLLIGTTPPPDGSDDAELDVLTDPSELKAALFERLRRGGRAVSPMDLEQAYKALRRAREVRRNLERLRACGSRVEYAHVDVRDFARLGVVVNGWRRLFGEPVGLIHGAGLIRDKLIRDKCLESFDRVLDTKLDGALNVARLLRPESLRFSVFFSSIAGRFGNRGQSDYAAANESLNKLAIWLDRRWPGRVVAPIWGPWSGIGMVSDLEDHLGSRGLGMISPEVGVAALVNELVRGRKGEVEVILAGDLGTLDAPLERTPRLMEALR
ncbi:MAG: SDR family NAD(P)-dependent oxidoreductase, partial [Isosphaeraceae bacterium]